MAELDVPATPDSSGDSATGGTDDGGDAGETTDAGGPITSVAVGYTHTCAVASNQSLWCWGYNGSGALGDGTYQQQDVPVQVKISGQSATGWSLATAGEQFTCGIHSSGTYCWGWNGNGSLGNAAITSSSTTPVPVDGGLAFTHLAAGKWHVCGIAAGNLYCWGYNDRGQVGDGTTTSRTSPVLVSSSGTWTVVAAAEDRSCGIDNGRFYCWGWGYAGQTFATPTQVGSDTDWSAVVAGESHTCGVRPSGVYCYGYNDFGQAGGTDTYLIALHKVADPGAWQLTAAGDHTCGVLGQQLYCWGDNQMGQLGPVLPQGANTTVALADPETGYTYVGTGPQHTCAVRDGILYCVGANDSGQLGISDPVYFRQPTRVGSASDWTKVVASDEASCGQRGDTLYCWGDNASGQVGDGSWLTQRAPTLVSGGDQSGWTSLAAVGYSGACAILSGDIYCWGQGVGPSGQTNATPVKFAAGPGWSAVFGGEWEDG
jgi:alpha-tubulin suppressor-like RCC1 family protein